MALSNNPRSGPTACEVEAGVGVEVEALSGHRRDGLAVVLMNPQALLEAQRELRPSVAVGRHQAARPRRRRRRLRHALVTWSLEENQ